MAAVLQLDKAIKTVVAVLPNIKKLKPEQSRPKVKTTFHVTFLPSSNYDQLDEGPYRIKAKMRVSIL